MKAPNEGAREFRYYVESKGGLWAMCEHKHLTCGEALARPHLSSCGAETVPWGPGRRRRPGLRHLMSGLKSEPRRMGLGWERPVASSRTRDET